MIEITSRLRFDDLKQNAKPQSIIFEDPLYARRYVDYMLDNEHAKGSREEKNIQQHVHWLTREVLPQKYNQFLDIGCGVGYYTRRLCQLGHQGLGIDIMDAAIRFAQRVTNIDNCHFKVANFLDFDFPNQLDSVIFPYCIFNCLSRSEAKCLLRKIYASLSKNGVFYFEPLVEASITEYPDRYWMQSGGDYLCEQPHISFIESQWSEDEDMLTVYNHIIDSDASVSSFYEQFIPYSCSQYEALLHEVGFSNVTFHYDVPGVNHSEDKGYLPISAQK